MQASGYWISYQGNPAGKAGEEGSKKCKFKLSVDISKPPCCDVTLLVLLQLNKIIFFFFHFTRDSPGDIGTDEDLGAKKGYGVASH